MYQKKTKASHIQNFVKNTILRCLYPKQLIESRDLGCLFEIFQWIYFGSKYFEVSDPKEKRCKFFSKLKLTLAIVELWKCCENPLLNKFEGRGRICLLISIYSGPSKTKCIFILLSFFSVCMHGKKNYDKIWVRLSNFTNI